MSDYEKIMRKKGLPDVGQLVRSKKFGTIWRVMEKRETWMNIDDDPQSREPRMIPSIYLSYWKVRDDAPPGVGKMMGHLYTLYDNTFEANWEKISKK